jgi:mono/diheme cytochrome c family protein
MVRFALPLLAALGSVALVAGSIWGGPAQAGASRPKARTPAAQRGFDFATVRCAGCHAIAPGGSSPNPEAPPFEAVANQRGLTGATLRQFLRDSHNYPEAMNFQIDRSAIDDLARYIVTLRSENYRPEI